jgi:hypothetical protein
MTRTITTSQNSDSKNVYTYTDCSAAKILSVYNIIRILLAKGTIVTADIEGNI